MLRRTFLSLAGTALAAPPPSPSRPNILVILTDDQGYGDFSAHGNPVLKTTNLDKLAAESFQFTRFYVSSVCAPTRASLLTGRYHLRGAVHGVTAGRETMRTNEVTLAEALYAQRYRTALIGKWHLGEHFPNVPHGQGFVEFTGFRTGHWNSYFDSPVERNGKPATLKGYITNALTDEAMRFLGANQKNPFLLYLAYNAPHSPFQVPEEDWNRWKDRQDLPKETRAVYAMVENIDRNIGRLMTELERLGLRENTIVAFLCDNGPNTQRYVSGLRGRKGAVYEGGIRSPLWLRWPARYQQVRKIDRMAAHIDLYPTLLELTGVAKPAGPPIDGKSLKPLLDGESKWPDRIFFSRQGSQRSLYPGAARTQRFSMINGKELYDLEKDPGETTNVAKDYPDVMSNLADAYQAWYSQVEAECGFEQMPIPVGYREENPVHLNATQSRFGGKLRFHNKQGYAHDWVSGWSDAADTVSWELDVVRAGTYAVSLRYLCEAANTGALMRVECGESKTEARIRQSTPMESLPDRSVVPGDHYFLMQWATVELGRIRLPKGRTRIAVRGVERRGPGFIELQGLSLKRG